MFNRAAFNQTPFNRALGVKHESEVVFDSLANLTASGANKINAGFKLSGNSEINVKPIRELSASTSKVSGSAEFIPEEFEIVKVLFSIFSASADQTVTARVDLLGTTKVESNAETFLSASTFLSPNVDFEGDSNLTIGVLRIMHGNIEAEAGGNFELISTAIRYSELIAEGITELKANIVAEYDGEALYEGTSETKFTAINNISSRIVFNGSSLQSSLANASYAGGIEVSAHAKIRAGIQALVEEVMTANLTLNPGDILIIDSCNFTATLNGVNVIEHIEEYLPEWININPKTQSLVVDGKVIQIYT